MATLFDLKEQRAGLISQQRSMIDKADEEKRALSADELSAIKKIDEDIDPLDDQIRRYEATKEAREHNQRRYERVKEEREEARRGTLAEISGAKGGDDEAVKSLNDHLHDCITGGATRKEALASFIKTYGSSVNNASVRRAASRFILSGAHSLTPQDKAALQERAGLQMDVDASGGTLVMPEQFIAQIIQGLDEQLYMRRVARVISVPNAESLGVPTLDSDPADSDWTTELSTGTEDTTMSTSKRNLHPHPLAKLLKVSKKLLRAASVSAEQLVRERLTFKFGVTEEKGFLTGNGALQPLGVFTASAQGISTGRDVSTDNTSTALTADGLINAKYNLMSQYLASANLRWIFHRTAIRNIRKLKDGNGQYLWTQGLSGQPDTILEVPYFMSEFAPSTFTSQQYVGIIGDFQYYWIAEAMRFELQRLDELYAATNQVGFIGRLEVDGMPVLEEAFSRVQLG